MSTPQTSSELVAIQLDWVQKNILNNLDFVPQDKLDWKPAPTAKSVLEIINHATETVQMFTGALSNHTSEKRAEATDLASAKAILSQVIEAHQKAVATLSPEAAGEIAHLPIGDFPKGIVAGLPVVELINHHGQITYIQTLLGDEDSHLVFG